MCLKRKIKPNTAHAIVGSAEGVGIIFSDYIERKMIFLGRSQTVLSSSSYNAKQYIQLGVPQGSVLGPILFSVYVTDIAGVVTAHGLFSHQYADDIQVYGHCNLERASAFVSRVSTCLKEVVS